MSKTYNTEQIIEKFKDVHADKYDYSLVNYIKSKIKVQIICRNHGVFEQTPMGHLMGRNCIKCAKDTTSQKLKNTTSDFINRAKEIHRDRYDYSLVEYLSAKTKVKIICPQHGIFEQTPCHHLEQSGCKKCATIKTAAKISSTKDEFIKEAKKVHNDVFDYDLVNYINVHKKVKIICKHHGIFEQSPSKHLRGSGCKKCARLINIYKKEDYIKLSPLAILYLVRIYNGDEEFYKIGKTKNGVKMRLSNKIGIYNYEIINEYQSDSGNIFDMEIELHKKYNKYQYKPMSRFSGYTECYNLDLPINEIISPK